MLMKLFHDMIYHLHLHYCHLEGNDQLNYYFEDLNILTSLDSFNEKMAVDYNFKYCRNYCLTVGEY